MKDVDSASCFSKPCKYIFKIISLGEKKKSILIFCLFTLMQIKQTQSAPSEPATLCWARDSQGISFFSQETDNVVSILITPNIYCEGTATTPRCVVYLMAFI